MPKFKVSTNALAIIEADNKEEAFEYFLAELNSWECDIEEVKDD